jgi:hypothetical protein
MLRRFSHFGQDRDRSGKPFHRVLVIGAVSLALASCTPRGVTPSASAVRAAPSHPPTTVAAETSPTHPSGQSGVGSKGDSVPPSVRLLLDGRDGYREVQRASLLEARWSGTSKAYKDGVPIMWPASVSIPTKRALRVILATSRRPVDIGVRIYGEVGATGEPSGAPLTDQRVAGVDMSSCEGNSMCFSLPLEGVGARFIALSGVWYIPTFEDSEADPGPRIAAWLLRIELEE